MRTGAKSASRSGSRARQLLPWGIEDAGAAVMMGQGASSEETRNCRDRRDRNRSGVRITAR